MDLDLDQGICEIEDELVVENSHLAYLEVIVSDMTEKQAGDIANAKREAASACKIPPRVPWSRVALCTQTLIQDLRSKGLHQD